MGPKPSLSKDEKKLSALESCKAARKLWLGAQTPSDLERVEKMYRRALKAKARRRDDKDDDDGDDGGPRAKKRRTNSNVTMELKKSDYKVAGEKLALIMCQSSRGVKAKMGLSSLGYTCRLASCVLDYPLLSEQHDVGSQPSPSSSSRNVHDDAKPPCIICDNFLNNHQQSYLKNIFEDPKSSYWADHNYEIEPPSPYFSYVLPLWSANHDYGFLGDLIRQIFELPQLRRKFPKLKNAKYVEMWLHNRPHPSGHQMHFDSDNEGRGGVRNPIISTIIYVTAGSGGPSLVTNQRLGDDRLATHGWLSHPKEKRLVAFDGRVLHGVVPGKGVKEGRRVTMMLAFWKDIKIRQGSEPGAARPFPKQAGDWLGKLKKKPNAPGKRGSSGGGGIIESPPIALDRVYETLDGDSWTEEMGLPEYDEVYQGF